MGCHKRDADAQDTSFLVDPMQDAGGGTSFEEQGFQQTKFSFRYLEHVGTQASDGAKFQLGSPQRCE